MRTRDDIDRPAQDLGYAVIEEGNCRKLRGPLGDRHDVEIVVPDEVTEWFLTVTERGTGKEVFSDWDEVYADGEPASAQDLASDMVGHVLRTLEILAAAEDCRVTSTKGLRLLGREFFKTTTLEVRLDGEWADYTDLVYPEED